jgi:peptidoglycan/LPS O-acetylase OafA/YrhL
MGGILGVGVALLVLGVIGLAFFPWGGAVAALVGVALIIAFLAGLGRRSPQPRP